MVKKARTQKAGARNTALRKAEELLKATPGAEEARLDWKEKCVKVKDPGQMVGESLTLGCDAGAPRVKAETHKNMIEAKQRLPKIGSILRPLSLFGRRTPRYPCEGSRI